MSRQQISDDQRAVLVQGWRDDVKSDRAERDRAEAMGQPLAAAELAGRMMAKQSCADDLAAALSGSSTAPGEAVTMANVGIATPASVVATSQEAPICAACAGKGWISPEDAERGIQENGEMFNAGYEHRKQHFEAAPASAVAVPQLRHDQGLAIAKALRGEISHGKLAEILGIEDVHAFKLAAGSFDEAGPPSAASVVGVPQAREAKMGAWQPIDSAPENEVVMTKIDDGAGVRNTQPMKRQGRLWWFADGSMYVYYTPTHWAALDRGDAREEQ